MHAVIDSGTARNLTNVIDGDRLTINSDEQKFVTFINDLGAVHTVIVPADHPAQGGDELLAWFNHTRGIAATSASVETSPLHVPAHEVIARANERMGFGDTQGKDANTQDNADDHPEG